MTKQLLRVSVLSILGVFVLSELLLPFVVARQAEAGLGRIFGTNDIQVSVKARPGLAMLGGNFSEITVNGNNVQTDKLSISRLSAVFSDTTIDPVSLISGQSLRFGQIGGFEGTVFLQEEDLAKYVAKTVKGLKNVRVKIEPENTRVTGDLTLGPAVVAVTMNGKLRGEENQIIYKAEQVLVNNATLGFNTAGSGLTQFTVFDLKKLPVPASLRDIRSEPGQVVIRIGK